MVFIYFFCWPIFDTQFDLHLFLKTANVIGRKKRCDLFHPNWFILITVAVRENKLMWKGSIELVRCRVMEIFVDLQQWLKLNLSNTKFRESLLGFRTPYRLEKQQRLNEQLSERLASFRIIGAQFRAILKPLRPSEHYRIDGFKRTFHFSSLSRETQVSKCFQSG